MKDTVSAGYFPRVAGDYCIDPNGDANVQGTRALHELLSKQSGITWTTVQTVGVKKHDGFTIVIVD